MSEQIYDIGNKFRIRNTDWKVFTKETRVLFVILESS